MPTPIEHLIFARETLRHPGLHSGVRAALEGSLAAYLLGNTAADVRTLTQQGRDTTHFYRTALPRNGSAAEHMLAQYPDLAAPRRLAPEHAAFISGYLTHLVWDEVWSWDIFVPFYRDAPYWSDRAMYTLHHDALRVHLDHKAHGELRRLMNNGCQLHEAEPAGWLPFVSDEDLRRWRDWLVDQLCRDCGVQTLHVLAERMHVPPAELEAVVAAIDDGTYRTVPGLEAALTGYFEHALAESCRVLARYWGGADAEFTGEDNPQRVRKEAIT